MVRTRGQGGRFNKGGRGGGEWEVKERGGSRSRRWGERKAGSGFRWRWSGLRGWKEMCR